MSDAPLVTDHTYFIMTPGVDRLSYIEYSDGQVGIYIKFGDQTGNPGKIGIRDQYRVHNPDIGIAAIMTDALPNEALGTRLKNLIAHLGWPTIGSGHDRTEWFSIRPARNGHDLFRYMQSWEGKTVDPNNIQRLENGIETNLGRPRAEAMTLPEAFDLEPGAGAD